MLGGPLARTAQQAAATGLVRAGLQVGVRQAGVRHEGHRVEAGRLEASLERLRQQAVGELRLAVDRPRVVLPAHLRVVAQPERLVLGDARQPHDARPGGAHEQGQQVGGEGPVADHVDPPLGLEPVGRRALGHRHHASVVHEHVEAVVGRHDGRRRGLDRGQRAEVELDDLQRRVGVARQDLGAGRLGLRLVAGRHDDVRAGPGECGRRGEAEATVAPGHDRDAAAQVGDVVGGPGHGCSSVGGSGQAWSAPTAGASPRARLRVADPAGDGQSPRDASTSAGTRRLPSSPIP